MIAGHRTVAAPAPPETAPQEWMRPRAVIETAMIVVAFLVLFAVLPHQIRGDDLTRLADINSLLHGHLTDSRFSLVGPLLSVPVLVLSQVTESRLWWAGHFNTVVIAVGAAIAYWQLRGRIDARLFRLTLLVLLCASFLTNRLRDYNAETITATLITLGVICLATSRHVVLGWAAIAIGVVNTPAAIVGMALLAGVYVAQTRQLRHLLAVAAAAAGIMLEAWVRRGGPFVTGYSHQHYSNPFALGLVAILFSFGRGLLFFTPGLVLWLNGRARRALPGLGAVVLMLAFVAGLVLIYSKWWAWYGGLSWGPRFFTFAAIPASFLIAAGIWRAGRSALADALTLIVLAFSAWVAWAGAITNLSPYFYFCRVNWHNQACYFRPWDSGLYQPVARFPHMTVTNITLTVLIGGVFLYLAAPLVASVARSLAARRSWALGWRFLAVAS